eukprot:TRINITY_DN6945_c0_g1_i1.p1 TRINITY_DN6945_c0_g1~~TRINITY_DN6945_c0_g1_i1.p1  ORF type:complete len:170 (-),score=15.47 TRINITY_DN6945_c0_g1_i1:71-580(-)
MLFCFSCTTPTEGGGRRGYGGVPSVLDEDVVALRRRRGRVGNASMIWTGLFWSWSVTGVSVCLLIVLAFLHSVLFIAKKSCQMRRAYVFCAVVWTLVYIYTLLMMPENWALRAGMFLHEGEYVSEVLITEWYEYISASAAMLMLSFVRRRVTPLARRKLLAPLPSKIGR